MKRVGAPPLSTRCATPTRRGRSLVVVIGERSLVFGRCFPDSFLLPSPFPLSIDRRQALRPARGPPPLQKSVRRGAGPGDDAR